MDKPVVEKGTVLVCFEAGCGQPRFVVDRDIFVAGGRALEKKYIFSDFLVGLGKGREISMDIGDECIKCGHSIGYQYYDDYPQTKISLISAVYGVAGDV